MFEKFDSLRINLILYTWDFNLSGKFDFFVFIFQRNDTAVILIFYRTIRNVQNIADLNSIKE